MKILETNRLTLRKMTIDDAPFMLGLLNEPSFIQNIGDRGVRDLAGSQNYILERIIKSYDQHGYGLYVVELKNISTPIGICGLVKRDVLKDADIGFAFLPEFWGKGYALEAAEAVLQFAKNKLALPRVLGIVSPGNSASIRVLKKLGLKFENMIQIKENEPAVKLFSVDFQTLK